MKKLLCFILLICLVCCNEKNSKVKQTVLYYPAKSYFNEHKLVKINISNQKLNFKKITNLVSNVNSRDSIAYTSIKYGDTLKKIKFHINDSRHIRSQNIMRIGEDSLFSITKDYKIDSLYSILKMYYENNGSDPRYAQGHDRVWVEIELDTNASGSDLEKTLLNLTNTFDELNKTHEDTLELKIGLSYFSQIPPPPPPPKDAENINIGI